MICLGLNYVKDRVASQSAIIGRFIPFPAVATANICNLVCMRYQELQDGVEVSTLDGETLGVSKIVAAQAISDTAITRVVLPMPQLILAPIFISVLERLKVFKPPRMHLFMSYMVFTTCFAFGLPFSMSLFEQYGQISVDRLEDHIQEAAREKGVTILKYNKGL
jgi:hypothetical protein